MDDGSYAVRRRVSAPCNAPLPIAEPEPVVIGRATLRALPPPAPFSPRTFEVADHVGFRFLNDCFSIRQKALLDWRINATAPRRSSPRGSSSRVDHRRGERSDLTPGWLLLAEGGTFQRAPDAILNGWPVRGGVRRWRRASYWSLGPGAVATRPTRPSRRRHAGVRLRRPRRRPPRPSHCRRPRQWCRRLPCRPGHCRSPTVSMGR
jgi:hypothetical protein